MRNGSTYSSADWQVMGMNMLLSPTFMAAMAEGYRNMPFKYDNGQTPNEQKLYEVARQLGIHVRIAKLPWPKTPEAMESLYHASLREDTRPRWEWQTTNSEATCKQYKMPELL
jgi:hypothetical protein